MKILFLTDSHFTAKNPSSRLDDIQQTILDKLLDVKKIIEDDGIDIVLHGGDMFHSPDVSNQFTGKIAKIIKSFGVPTYVVPGNLDLYGYNYDTLSNTKLGLLEKTDTINIISREKPLVINDNGFIIGIEAQEYHPHIDEDISEDFKINNINVDYSILLIHSMLLESKFHEGVKHTLIKDVYTNADLVLAGHYHDGWKERKQNNTWFFNPGSFLRVEASTAMINSKPRVVVFDIGKDKFDYKYVELPSAKDGKVIFSSKNLAKRLYNIGLTEFHNKLKKQKFSGVNIINLINNYSKDLEYKDACEYAISKINQVSIKSCDNGYISEDDTITINKVELHNFQTHTEKIVDFVDGLNVIVGESNAGKTSILRAIHWCLYDKPNGSDFIRTGAKSCKVILHLSNGFIIERKRSRSSSGSYILAYPDGSKKEFKGFSNNIPVEILNANQMPEIKINGTSYKINVAMQLDSPFLIGNSPTERLSLLGALVDADRADVAKREINAERRRNNLERSQLIELKEKKEEELKKYDHLDKMKKDLDLLEIAVEKLESDEVKINSIKSIRDNYNSLTNNLSATNNKLNNIAIPDINLINDLKVNVNNLDNLKTISDKYKYNLSNYNIAIRLLDDIPDIHSLKDASTLFNNKLNELETLNNLRQEYKILNDKQISLKLEKTYDTDSCIKLLNELNNTLNMLEKLKSFKDTLDNYNNKLTVLNGKITAAVASVDTLLQKKQDKIDSLQGVEEVCKYCGSKININKMLGVE